MAVHFVAHLAGLHLAAVLDEAQREARPGTRRARADAAPEADSGVGVGFLASPRPDSTRLSNTPAFSHVESDTQANPIDSIWNNGPMFMQRG